jgi:GNAT superfamily N-acetyltransferase
MSYGRPEPLRGKHVTDGFECGEPSLDAWLYRHARQAEAANSSRVYVTTDDDSRVVGFYALSAAQVHPKDASKRLIKGQARHHAVPVILIGRLAVDKDHQGRGLGRSLLRDVVAKAPRAASLIGARAIAVDALSDDAADFYRRFGFEDSPTDSRHLILLMKDVEKLAETEPEQG